MLMLLLLLLLVTSRGRVAASPVLHDGRADAQPTLEGC